MVTIKPSVTTGSHTAGVAYNVTLNKGQTYQLRNTDSWRPPISPARIVTSTKPIGVFGGHQCANIPNGSTFDCDHVVEELPPTETWGKSFVTEPLADAHRRRHLPDPRLAGWHDGEGERRDGRHDQRRPVHRAAAHRSLDDHVRTSRCSLRSTPTAPSFDGVTSDPFMMLIPPYEQFLNSYTVTTPATGFSTNYINLVVPNGAVGSVKVDGVAVPAGSYHGHSGIDLLRSSGSGGARFAQPDRSSAVRCLHVRLRRLRLLRLSRWALARTGRVGHEAGPGAEDGQPRPSAPRPA